LCLSEDKKRSLRDRSILKTPKRYEANLVEFNEPALYKEAVTCKDGVHWIKAINEELKAPEENEIWIFENLPEGKKTIGSKWVFKVKPYAL